MALPPCQPWRLAQTLIPASELIIYTAVSATLNRLFGIHTTKMKQIYYPCTNTVPHQTELGQPVKYSHGAAIDSRCEEGVMGEVKGKVARYTSLLPPPQALGMRRKSLRVTVEKK